MGALFVAAVVCLTACRTVPATQVLVFFHAEPALTSRASNLEVRVFGGASAEAVFESTEAISLGGAGSLARVPLIPEDGDASRRFRIEGALLEAGGARIATVTASGGYVRQELRELHLWFDATCEGVDCGEGRTCQAGECVGACFVPEAAGGTRSVASCGECELCTGGACTARPDDSTCGCPGDVCLEGACRNASPVRGVFAGAEHTCAEIADRGLFCWGSDRVGMIAGAGGAVPEFVANGASVEGGAGIDHTCFVDFQRRPRCFGWNGSGQIGDGDVSPVPLPPTWIDGTSLLDLDAGFDFTCGIETSDGGVVCWGGNAHGVFGPITMPPTPFPTPTRLTEPGRRFTDVSAAGYHVCARDDGGRLFCWGYNNSGEGGIGATTVDVLEPTQAACSAGSCIEDWSGLGTGSFHTCGIRATGELWCWGGNRNGQLGVVTSTTNVTSPVGPVEGGPYDLVEGGTSHTCGLTETGRVLCWGRNDYGQVGVGSTENVPRPTEILMPGAATFRGIGLGQEHSCAIRTDETLWCWGLNMVGQLGLGGRSDDPVTRPRRVCMPPP